MSATAPYDKFTGKHTTLDVKTPDLEGPEDNTYAEPVSVEDKLHLFLTYSRDTFDLPKPFVPDFWDSKAKTAAAEAATQSPEPPLPKVVTAAAEGTFPGGGPSSRIYQPSETLKAFKESGKQNAAKTSGTDSNSLSKLSSLANLTSSSGKWATSEDFISKPSAEREVRGAKKKLNHEEVRGLYVLLGIVGGGWLLGAIFSPKKPQKHH
jgi:hypothetical protein